MLHSFRLFLAALCLWAVPAGAARVSPMVVELEPAGRGAIARVQMTNTASQDIPVEARIYLGDVGENGELTLTPADEDWLVFPAQQLVPARGEQVFRVQYVGDPQIERSRIYYLSLQQVPVDLESGQPAVQVVIRFNVLLKLDPRDARAAPEVLGLEPGTDAEGRKGVYVRIANRGTGTFKVGDVGWRFYTGPADDPAAEYGLSGSQVTNIVGVGVVAPDRVRRFFVPIEDQIDLTQLALALE